MIKWYNKCIPVQGYKAMTVWPVIFLRSTYELDDVVINHEEIHGAQQVEVLMTGLFLMLVGFIFGFGWWSLLFLPIYFYWYGIEYIVRGIIHKGNWSKAYRSISFEQEAYKYESDMTYLKNRALFAWVNYLK